MSLLFKNIVGNQMKKYKTTKWNKDPVEEVEIEKETSIFVWIKGQRHKKETEYHCFFDTREEAFDYLIKQEIAEIALLKQKVQQKDLRVYELEILSNRLPFIDRKE